MNVFGNVRMAENRVRNGETQDSVRSRTYERISSGISATIEAGCAIMFQCRSGGSNLKPMTIAATANTAFQSAALRRPDGA